MTLADAKKLSPQQLAERLLGATGASGGYVEANVQGNGGLMIHQPGLNYIDLYKVPKSAGNLGLCAVEGVHVSFEASRYDTPGDPPHRVSDFWKFKRFAILNAKADRSGDTDYDREGKACAKLLPVIGATEPTWFATPSNSENDAYFAVRTMAKAQAAAATLGAALTCRSEDAAACGEPIASVTAIPIRRIHFMEVKRCADGMAWCVETIWEKSRNGKDPWMVDLEIRTDALKADWEIDFKVTAIAITAGTWIVD